jgi:ribonuclease HI/exonuclease III
MKGYQPTTKIPHITAASININSLSSNPTDPKSTKAQRHRYVIDTITTLLSTNHILMIQETHLATNDERSLAKDFPDHTILYNNGSLGRAGTIIMLHNTLKQTYHIRPRKLDHPAAGRVQVVRLYPKLTREGDAPRNHKSYPIQLINFYLPAHSHNEKRAPLQALLQLKRHKQMYTVAMGDFNFVEHPGDHTPLSRTVLLDHTTERYWSRVLRRFKLSELAQPIHTYYHITSSLESSRSSRIDRIYTSYSQADTCVVHPCAYVPHLQHSKIDDFNKLSASTGPSARRVRATTFSTDHLPIAIRFAPPNNNRPPYRAYAPKWLAARPTARPDIIGRWQRDHQDGCPYKDLFRWKLSVHSFVKQHFQDRKKTKHDAGMRTASLSAAISVYRACVAHPLVHTHLRSLLAAHTDLGALVELDDARPGTAPDTRRLRDRIRELISQGATAKATPPPGQAETDEDPCSIYPPPPTAPSLGSNFSPIDQIKGRLPSTRTGLQHLRASPADPPTSNPTEMGAIAKASWGAIWAARKSKPSKRTMAAYLSNYTTRLPDGSLRDMPSLEDMIGAVRDTNNSSPGPDGIPFAYYRLCAEEVAPVLLRILALLASGRKPPAGFNNGTLFLLAKDGSLLIDHTRPISVTNADNRIIAKLLANLLGPIFNETLHTSQKGFIPKRCGLDHVRAISSLFYGAVTKKDQHYILFLDTKKAFDSVDHAFVHMMLAKIGVPAWIRHTIHGLMTNVTVRPSFGSTEHDIPIHRGVKQGCPLSPLLFALCYDYLLTQLAQPDTHGAFAFADDLALESSTIQPIIDALHKIKRFARFSGLGLNLDKTVVLSSLPPSKEAAGRLHLWFPDIRFVTRAKYLGVIMGPDITTTEIFQEAVDKFFARARQFSPVVRSSTLHQRILIYNVFLLPILFYLAQFFIMPYREMIVPIREHCRKAICAFKGGAFAYCHLINTPRSAFGPYSPLRDLWATNMTLLASRSPLLLASDGHGHPQMGDFEHVTDPDWGTLLVEEHEAYCAWLFLYDHGPRGLHRLLRTEHLSGSIKMRRRHIYNQLISEGYWQERDEDKRSFRASLPRKLRRFLPATTPDQMQGKIRNLKANLLRAGSTPRPGQWNTWLRFLTNSLPTDRRLAAAGIFPKNRTPGQQLACFLCHEGEDDLRHIFGECAPVEGALRSAARKLKITLPATATIMDLVTLTIAPPTPVNPIFPIFIITFVWAVWSDRQRFFSTLPQPLSLEQTALRLEEYSLCHLPQSRAKRTTPAEVLKLANNPPPEALVGFSDGSAIPNPGPCGAGALLFLPNNAGKVTCAMSLGQGDNNVGEIAGLLKLLCLIDEAYRRGLVQGHPAILLFTDSLLVVGALEWGWAIKNMPPSIRSLLKAYRARKALNPLLLYWVKAHSDVQHNETVDQEAKDGATWSCDPAQDGHTRTLWETNNLIN